MPPRSGAERSGAGRLGKRLSPILPPCQQGFLIEGDSRSALEHGSAETLRRQPCPVGGCLALVRSRLVLLEMGRNGGEIVGGEDLVAEGAPGLPLHEEVNVPEGARLHT